MGLKSAMQLKKVVKLTVKLIPKSKIKFFARCTTPAETVLIPLEHVVYQRAQSESTLCFKEFMILISHIEKYFLLAAKNLMFGSKIIIISA